MHSQIEHRDFNLKLCAKKDPHASRTSSIFQLKTIFSFRHVRIERNVKLCHSDLHMRDVFEFQYLAKKMLLSWNIQAAQLTWGMSAL